MQFEEIPQVVFEVKDSEGKVVYRDAIIYGSMAELRQDSISDRQVKFQERYDNWRDAIENPQEPTPEEGESPLVS